MWILLEYFDAAIEKILANYCYICFLQATNNKINSYIILCSFLTYCKDLFQFLFQYNKKEYNVQILCTTLSVCSKTIFSMNKWESHTECVIKEEEAKKDFF